MKMLKNLITLISALAAAISLIAITLLLLGYRPFVLLSPSMEPLYREGSLCLINTHTSLDEVDVGDVLVYRTADVLVLHRLVGISERLENGLVVEMQGDANNISQTLELNNINYVGREAFTVPGLGYAVTLLSSAPSITWGLSACFPYSPVCHGLRSAGEDQHYESQNGHENQAHPYGRPVSSSNGEYRDCAWCGL